MKNRRKLKAVDKPRRNHPDQDETSKEIDSLKGASGDKVETPQKAERNTKTSKAEKKTKNTTHIDVVTSKAHGMDTHVVVQKNGHSKVSNGVYNRQPTDQELELLSVALVKKDGSQRKQYLSPEKQDNRDNSQGHSLNTKPHLAEIDDEDIKISQEILPIHVTTAMNDVSQMRYLFERDAVSGKSRCDPNIRCLSDGSTALLLAIRSKQTEAAKILLENDADVTLTDNTGDNALMAAIKSGDANVINAIWPYRRQLDVNHVNYAGWSALHLATDRKWECCINFLLQNRANPNCQSTDGVTPLMLAAGNGDTKSADNLIKSDADILMEDYNGNTCICKAFTSGEKDMVHYLLRKLPNDRKDVFIRSRLDMMLHTPEDDRKLLENTYLPILHMCTEEPVFRSSFYNSRAVQKITQIIEQYNQCFEITILASHLIFCIMFRFSREIDVKFVKQFIRCRGPENIVFITKLYTEHWKIPEREIVTIFLPMIGLPELAEGRAWLKKNWVSVSEYLNFFDKNSLKYCLSGYSDSHWCPDCDYVDEIAVVWQHFHDVMNEIQTEERGKHMTELLEEEEREKERQSKKKEKKKQKKQEKEIALEDNFETATLKDTRDESRSETSDTSLITKNANSNAGPEDSKLTRKQKKASDLVKTNYQTSSEHTPLSFVYFESGQISTEFPELISTVLYPKTEQWTTIQTKKQLQKEKEKKQSKKTNESVQPDSQGTAKKTPQKSTKKKNSKGDQNVSVQTFSTAPVNGSTRWADIAKGMVKTNTKDVPNKHSSNNNIKVRQRQVNFGDVDFPSLHGQHEDSFGEKKSYIQPAKFTFHFHDEPTCEPKQNESIEFGYTPIDIRNEKNHVETESQYVAHEDQCSDMYNQNTTCIAEAQSENNWVQSDGPTEEMVETWVETEMSNVWDDNSGNTTGDYQQYEVADNDMQEHINQKITTEYDDYRYAEEDWPLEVEHTESVCDGGQTSTIYDNVTSNGSMITITEMNNAELLDHANSTRYQREQTSQTKKHTPMNVCTDYVGPENCQVDINTIIQHQTMALPFFEENVIRNRNNDPFFDPSVPLSKELRFVDETQTNAVDALFEDSEEIPNWYPDNESLNHEASWNDIVDGSSAYEREFDPSACKEDFTSVDPAIIGYKNMTIQQPFLQDVRSDLQDVEARQPATVEQVQPGIDYLAQESIAHEHAYYNNEYNNETDSCNRLDNDNVEKQTAVIKPLQSVSKNATTVMNSAYGQRLLENACQLERDHHDDIVAYPDEIDGEPFPHTAADVHTDFRTNDIGSGDNTFHFPSFHADTKLSGHMDKRDVSVFHMMQQVQLEQLSRYYKQNKPTIVNEPASRHHDNFVYYASCAGMSKQDMDGCLSGKVDQMQDRGSRLNASSKPNKTFKDITKPSAHPSQQEIDTRTHAHNAGYHHMTQTGGPQHIVPQAFNRQMPHMPIPNMFPVGQYNPPPMHPANIQMIQATQAAMAASVMNQIKEVYKNMMKAKMKSVRWKEELWQLRNLPTEKQMVVGKIVIPKEDRDRIYIARSSSGPTILGFLTDGTEVAIKVIDWRERDFTLEELQHLVNLDVSKYFMNKYKAFCSQDGHYYIAMTLYEYSLPEYLSRLQQDEGVDEAITSSKLVWQFMRGIASLHQHCLMVHGELRPDNVVIDTDGNVRIAGYGLGKNTNRDTPFVEYTEDEKCWLAPEVLVHKQKVSFKSDIFVVGMLTYYILSGGKNPFGTEPCEIVDNIAEQAFEMERITEEAGHLLALMLSVNKSERPCISDALRHPYFWADEKRLRFILICGSDVLRDLKAGVPMDGSIRDSMIGIIGTAPCSLRIINWTSDIEPVIMREMRVFRQYKNNVVELVLFIYNCCLHFDKMPDHATEIIDEPCKYFLNKFPALFMTVYRAIKNSSRTERTCYKPFF